MIPAIQSILGKLTPFEEMKRIIEEESFSIASLNAALATFQRYYKQGTFTPQETALLVEAGKAQRAKLSTAEKKNVARESLAKATFQSHGATGPHPEVMQHDEHELYRLILKLNPELPDAFMQLERLELRYMERERSEYGKKWLVPAITQKLAEIGTAWAERAGAP
jgi:hypothetical protein